MAWCSPPWSLSTTVCRCNLLLHTCARTTGCRTQWVSCAVLCVASCACPASQLASMLSAIARHVLHTTLPLDQARPHDVEHLPSIIAEPKGEASNRDALSSPVCIYVYMYICPSQPETPRLCNSPMFSAGAHDNKMLYLTTMDHESAQHSTSSLHVAFKLLLTSLIASSRATRLLAILP